MLGFQMRWSWMHPQSGWVVTEIRGSALPQGRLNAPLILGVVTGPPGVVDPSVELDAPLIQGWLQYDPLCQQVR